jgi:dephospho-CoA kinase
LFVVALTGGIASGKSTVCDLLEDKGAYIICSDALAREVVQKGEPAWRDIVDHFGESVLDGEGEIDRARLSEIVFSDPAERGFLNSVTHPRIFQLMFERLKARDLETGGTGVAVLDIPLLVDVEAPDMFDFTLVVDASPEVQLERIVEDRGSSREEALARINAQVPRERRLAFADHIIRNEGSLDELRREVDEAWKAILSKADLS